MIKIISWNVNGIRAAIKNGFYESFKSMNADILGLQEVKSTEEKSGINESDYNEYSILWNAGNRAGYSGVALFSKLKINEYKLGFGVEKFDIEGRIIEATYDDFILFNIYFPNGQKDDERLRYKLEFYDVFLDIANSYVKKGKKLIIMGDFNTAHKPIDLANPKQNEKYSGFLPVERAWIDKFIENGYIDTFRFFYPNDVKYSWWTYKFNAREKNIGWRIDYVFVSRNIIDRVKSAFILNEIKGSDHCPVGIELN